MADCLNEASAAESVPSFPVPGPEDIELGDVPLTGEGSQEDEEDLTAEVVLKIFFSPEPYGSVGTDLLEAANALGSDNRVNDCSGPLQALVGSAAYSYCKPKS